ncbi:leucine-rich repeat-containing protein 15-like [Lineus longissimus]|uniref:leucine-rich repeat-containing protein 15-like n=1 Tax=Lineus longissimus TaxID=88925 RepID=UPI00315D0441
MVARIPEGKTYVSQYFVWCAFVWLIAILPLRSRTGAVGETNIPDGCQVVTSETDGKTLTCRRAPFHEILAAISDLGKDLVKITVQSCQPQEAVELNQSCFPNNANLKNLWISECGLVRIAPYTFQTPENLTELSLFGNQIRVLTNETFKGLRKLLKLDLRFNQISSIPDGSFKDLESLSILMLDNNKLLSVTNGTFKGLRNLADLELIRNKIHSVADNSFGDLKKLLKLNLMENKIGVITGRIFNGLKKLRNLYLSYNQITWITPGSFEGLDNLSKLGMNYNKIGHLTNGMFRGLGNLHWLGLSSNSLYCVEDGTLSDLKNLLALSLKGQRSQSFKPSPYLFAGLKRLQKLYFEFPRIDWTGIDKENLSVFFGNQVQSLTTLEMQSSQLTNNYLPILKNLKSLNYLLLRDNSLGYVLKESLPKLGSGTLDLSSNRIMYIETGALSRFSRGNTEVILRGNSFSCECQLLGFSRWIRENGMNELDTLTCSGPVSMYGKRVRDYNPYWWQCSPYVPLIALVAIIGLVVLVCSVAMILYCNRVNIQHWLLERRLTPRADEEAEAAATERSRLVPSGLCGISSLPRGRTEAYILYNMNEQDVKRWVDQYIEEKLYGHPLRVTLQWAAGPDYIPLWKQVKEYGFGVIHFVVIVTEDLLKNHWPEMSANSGVENLSKFVLVLMGMKKKDLPKELLRMHCPCLEWPETKRTSVQRERQQFWKRLRLVLKDTRPD